MNAEQQVNQWGQIVAEAWEDESFKKRLLAEPAAVLKDHGLEVQQGVQVRVVENSDKVLYLTLPAKPKEGELSEDELAGVAGGNPLLIGIAIGAFSTSLGTVGVLKGAGADVNKLAKEYAGQKGKKPPA